jgi:endoglucanase
MTALAVPAGQAAPAPVVSGTRLVDTRTGQPFMARGVDAPSFEYACQQGYGYSDTAEDKNVGPDANNAAMMASWHINVVRVPLNQDCWLGDDGQPSFGNVEGYRAAVASWVTILHNAGMVVILDLQWSGPDGVVADGLHAMPDDRSDDFWVSVASAFKDDPSVIFDAFNEPYSRYDGDKTTFDLTWDCWRNGGCQAPRANENQPFDGSTYTTLGMQAMVDAIRGTGAAQPIMLGGRDYSNDLAGWLDNRPGGDQLIASFHNYNATPCQFKSCWDSTIAPVAQQVPVITGELGASDCERDRLDSYMDWADQHGVGYLMWAWWILPSADCSQLATISDPRGTPRAPNGTALKSHLAGLAGGAAGDRTRPRLSLGGAARQRLDLAVEVGVRCNEACRARAFGTLVTVTRARRTRTYRLAGAFGALRAARTRTLGLKTSRAARLGAGSVLRGGGSATAKLTINVMDPSGNATRRTRSIRLRLGR